MFGFDAGQDPFDVGFHEGPRALVFRFFLTPDHSAFLKRSSSLTADWQGRDRTVRSADVDVVDAARVAFFEQIEVDLARTHHDAFDFVVGPAWCPNCPAGHRPTAHGGRTTRW